MSSPWFFGLPSRRGLFAAEVVTLVVTVLLDQLLAFLTNPAAPSAAMTTGLGGAVLAVLRRRFPFHVGILASATAAICLFTTVVSWTLFSSTESPPTVGVEVSSLALLVGASCRRLPARQASAVAVLCGAAMVSAPVVRYGVESPLALAGVLAALAWGAALAVGLILRDADNRHLREVAAVRTGERLRLARELHDLVAHHVTGIVVRAHAARSLAGKPHAPEQDPVEVYADIEQAGAEAMSAMRKLVGMLRTHHDDLLPHGTGFGAAVRQAVGKQATVDLPAELDELPIAPEVATTAHRVVLEALTNVRRHSPDATEVLVTGRLDRDDIIIEVVNDNVPSTKRSESSGYGLIGMSERVDALGGVVQAGLEADQRWRVSVRLPRGSAELASDNGREVV